MKKFNMVIRKEIIKVMSKGYHCASKSEKSRIIIESFNSQLRKKTKNRNVFPKIL